MRGILPREIQAQVNPPPAVQLSHVACSAAELCAAAFDDPTPNTEKSRRAFSAPHVGQVVPVSSSVMDRRSSNLHLHFVHSYSYAGTILHLQSPEAERTRVIDSINY